MSLSYHLLDVFADVPFGGNQLAVFPEADGLDPALMQRIARELNLSETAFLLAPGESGALRTIRTFTPSMELPFAGHPTVGAAHLLVDLGIVPLTETGARFTLQANAGPVPIVVQTRPEGGVFIQLTSARLPEAGPRPPSTATLAAILQLEEADLEPDGAQAVSAGVPFLFIPLTSRAALRRARVHFDRWQTELSSWWAPHVVPFCREAEHTEADFSVRMFAPQMGIVEDPATGAAGAAFGGYLAWRAPETDGTLRWTLEQGVDMGRPSLLRVEADKSGGRLVASRVGGSAVRIGEGRLYEQAMHAPCRT
jgi:trans-2,3-dihydro-3-hydroxyanthranilate isomerase